MNRPHTPARHIDRAGRYDNDGLPAADYDRSECSEHLSSRSLQAEARRYNAIEHGVDDDSQRGER